MKDFTNKLNTSPLRTERSVRLEEKRILTSGNAGKVLPIAYVPLLREDSVQTGKMRFRFDMMETAETLMNAVNVTVNAHFVPYLAFERYNGMDQLNRSYKGQPEVEGGAVIPFVDTALFGANGANEVYKTLGLHARADQMVNTAVLEAYNTVVNFRRKQRSTKLTQRTRLDSTLAEAFWHHTLMKHIVPDFDQAMLDGEVALNVVDALLPIQGIGTNGSPTTVNQNVFETGGTSHTYANAMNLDDAASAAFLETGPGGVPQVFAELQQNGITVSLSNIELAKKTAAFARMRQTYQGYDDDYIVDLLMDGVRVPEQAMSQPILLAQKSTLFGYSQRYASDGASLDKSVTTGETSVELNLRLPPMNTGGVIIITAEITPEQLFERQKDYFLHAGAVSDFPEYVRDALDPEKVSVVQNQHVDIDHTDPQGVFGYAPLNHEWVRRQPNIGGKYYRPDVDAAFDEDRQKIWAVETVDPTLTEDFYLCTAMHQKVFADTTADAFEIMGSGRLSITGNTVFGARLEEATDDYDVLKANVETARIVKP